jgi:hypothetical protein
MKIKDGIATRGNVNKPQLVEGLPKAPFAYFLLSKEKRDYGFVLTPCLFNGFYPAILMIVYFFRLWVAPKLPFKYPGDQNAQHATTGEQQNYTTQNVTNNYINIHNNTVRFQPYIVYTRKSQSKCPGP